MKALRRGSCLLVLALWAAGCGPADDPALQSARDDAAAALADGDASKALQLSRRALTISGDDAELMLLAGTAALDLKRFSDAADYADRALPLAASSELKADVRWLQGKALMGRFTELHNEDDWRQANVSLEPATSAGHHRTDAALMLVVLQDMSPRGDAARQLRFARELLVFAPDSAEANTVSAYLKQRGIDL